MTRFYLRKEKQLIKMYKIVLTTENSFRHVDDISRNHLSTAHDEDIEGPNY